MDEHMKFITAMFEAETSVKVSSISQIGFSSYMVQADDGNQYLYKC